MSGISVVALESWLVHNNCATVVHFCRYIGWNSCGEWVPPYVFINLHNWCVWVFSLLILFSFGDLFKEQSCFGFCTTFVCITGLLITRWIYSKTFTLKWFIRIINFFFMEFVHYRMVPYLKKEYKPFKHNNRAKCYFYPRLCYFWFFNLNTLIRNISTCSKSHFHHKILNQILKEIFQNIEEEKRII
jgi:hypothetical protein